MKKSEAGACSPHRLWWRSVFGYPVALMSETLGLTPRLLTDNLRAGIVQYQMIRAGLIGYGVVYGEK